ncbi:MAG: tetratricopeptide repeat protein [Deltaproteobacteria bacterium]|nr:tetratricopeptide repeat protein [Deltaproteobacteria bacterium]
MARIIKRISVILAILISYKIYGYEDVSQDSSAIDAYHHFRKFFELRQEEILEKAQKKYQSEWNSALNQKKKNVLKAQADLIEKMKESEYSYRNQLEKFPDAENRPFVLMNLAQILYLLHEYTEIKDEYLKESLLVLEQIDQNFTDFDHYAQALFLIAQIYSIQGNKEKSLNYWKKIISLSKNSVFHIFAYTALGDEFFYQKKAELASQYYHKALEIEKKHPQYHEREFSIALKYRIAWSSYRSGHLSDVLNICLELIKPENESQNHEKNEKIREDVIRLAGESLFELSETSDISEYLMTDQFGSISPDIGIRIIQRYHTHQEYSKIIPISDFLIREYPGSLALPFLLNYLAISFNQTGQIEKAIQISEKLGMFLPQDSLWRSSHKNHPEQIKMMEKISFQAAEQVANWHFNTGISSGIKRHFLTSASFFEILIKFNSDHKSSQSWKLKQAHCYFKSSNYSEADMLYSAIIFENSVDPESLNEAFWYLIINREILWKKSLQNSSDFSDQYDSVSINLKNLSDVIDKYYSRFPNKETATEALLIAANAYSESGKYNESITYWSRVLGKKTSIQHRSAAIRGLIFSNLKGKLSAETISVLTNILRIEDWSSLGYDLRGEILEILSKTVLIESKRLAESGQQQEAGKLLFSVSQEMKEIPSRALLLRDSAYYMAIISEWNSAAEISEYFFSQNMNEYKDDMLYVLAKCYEYQLKFEKAAKTYLSILKSYPHHKKSNQIAERAENLAVAEDLYAIASEASEIRSGFPGNRKNKALFLRSAALYALQNQDISRASELSHKYLSLCKTSEEKLRANLLIATIMIKNGHDKNGINLLQKIRSQAKLQSVKIGEEPTAEIIAESSITEGDEYKKTFDRIIILNNNVFSESGYARKNQTYKMIKKSYEHAMQSGYMKRLSEARFKLADISDQYASELAASLNTESLTATLKEDLRKNILKLKAQSDRLFSLNILSATPEQDIIPDDIWYQKSIWRKGKDIPSGKENLHVQIPEALHFDLPYLWRL